MESTDSNNDSTMISNQPNPYPTATKYTREEMILIKESESSQKRPDYLSREFDDETGRFIPDKWFDQMFAIENSKNSLAGRKKNLSRMEDELGLSPQRRQFTGGCVPGSNTKNQGSGKWRNGKTVNSDGQRHDNQGSRWRSRNDDNGDRSDRYRHRQNNEESLPEWADSSISIHDVMELKGFDGTPPVTSKIPTKDTSGVYSEAELLEELKRKGPITPAQKESTSGSRFIHLFNKRNAENHKPPAPGPSKDPLHGLGNLFSQPQENLPSMPFSGVMAADFESKMNIAEDEKKLLPELTNAIRSPANVHAKNPSFPSPPVRSENNTWTEEAILAEILGKNDLEKKDRTPSREKESWNGASNAPASCEFFGIPRNEPQRRQPLPPSPTVIPPSMTTNLRSSQLQNQRHESITPPLLPPAFDQVVRNCMPNDMNRPSQRSDSPSSTSSRRSVPQQFNNFPSFPNGPMPPPSMFIPGLNGMPMVNPFAFGGMNFPPGMMPPPMGGAPPPPQNMNRSGVNLPTSVLLRRRNNEASSSPDIDQQQRPPMRTEMTNLDSNLHGDNVRQNSPLPDDPSEVRSGSRNSNFGNPQNERPPNMMANMFPFDLMMCNMFSMPPGNGPMPPMGVPDSRGFTAMPRMPPPGMSIPRNMPPGYFFPMQNPMCPPGSSKMAENEPPLSSPSDQVSSIIEAKPENEADKEPETPVDKVNEVVPEPVIKSRTPSPEPVKPDGRGDKPKPDGPEPDDHGEGKSSPDKPDQAEDGPKPKDEGRDKPSPNSPVPVYERDPNDIEEEIPKVILAGYTDDKEVPKEETLLDSAADVHIAQSQAVEHTSHDTRQVVHKSNGTTIEKKAPLVDKKNTAKHLPTKLATPSKVMSVKSPSTKDPNSGGPKKFSSTPSSTTRKPPPTAIKSTPAPKSLTQNTRITEKPKMPISSGSRTSSVTRTPIPKSASSTSKPGSASNQGKVLPVTPKLSKKYENVKGRINATSDYKPGGGNVKIFHEKPKFNVTSKIGSLENAKHVPGGGQVKIENRKLNFKENAKPKIDAKAELQSPKVEKKVVTQKLEWKAESKIGSLANADHKPAGGDVKIFHQKVQVEAKSKIGSLENADHKPTGGNVKISEYKVTPKSTSTGNSSTNSRRSSTNATRNSTLNDNMPGCKDPTTVEQVFNGSR